ncbi:MAG: alpha/beta hydrolase [Planctomycetaceae bacterium]
MIAIALAAGVTVQSLVPASGEEPPDGYSSATLIKLAIASGQLKLLDRELPVPETVQVTRGIEYGTVGDASLQLDLYAPKGLKDDVPVLVFIHGGGWKGGSREDYHYYGVRFAEKGYVVATISYRLSGIAPFPAAVQDAKCAVRWVRKHAAEYHIDPNRIAAAGGSAGGHLVMMVGYSSDVPDFDRSGGNFDVSSRVQAVVNFYGPVDLTTPYARSHELVTSFIGRSYDDATEAYRSASPLTHITSDDPPTLTFHGTLDDLVPVEQADTLDAALKKAGVESRYERLEGWPHGMDLAQVVNDYCFNRMLEFFDQTFDIKRQPAAGTASSPTDQ